MAHFKKKKKKKLLVKTAGKLNTMKRKGQITC